MSTSKPTTRLFAVPAILMIIVTLIGCSAPTPVAPAQGTGTSAGAPASAATTQAQKAQPQGELTIAIQDTIVPALDPNMLSSVPKDYATMVFDSLVGLTPDELDFAPGIATKWESTPDLKTWTFYLRKDATFSNGQPVTGEDVKFSMQRILRADALATNAPTFRALIADIQVPDPNTVKFLLKSSSLSLVNDLSIMTGNGEGMVVPKDYIEKNGEESFRKNPIGSGPYKIVKVDPGNTLQLEARADYWGGAPKYKTLTFKSIPEATTALAALKTGQVDIIQIAPDLVQQVKDAGFQVFAKENSQELAIAYHDTGDPQYPQSNLKVRQALSLAVNRDDISKSLLAGYGKPFAGGFPQHPNGYGYAPVKPPLFDAQKAKQLLTEAGYPNGFAVSLYSYRISGIPNPSLIVEAVAGYWDKIGVKAKITPIDFTAFRNDLYTKKKTNGAFSGVMPGSGNRKVPTSYYQAGAYSKSALTVVSDPKLDKLIDDLVSASTLDQYKQINGEISRYIDENQFGLGIAMSTDLYAASKKVTDWKLGLASMSMNTRNLVLAK